MLDEIEPSNPKQYWSFLHEIYVMLVCYPDSMLIPWNMKDRVRYSPKNKEASITLVVNYNDYVYSDKPTKAKLVAEAIVRGLNMLKERLTKYKLSIDDLVENANVILNKYLF